MRIDSETGIIFEDDSSSQKDNNGFGRKLQVGLALAGFAGLLALVPVIGRTSNNAAIDRFYGMAEKTREYISRGSFEGAEINHEEMWRNINQYQTDSLRNPSGRLTEAQMDHLEKYLHSTNVFTSNPMPKPKKE